MSWGRLLWQRCFIHVETYPEIVVIVRRLSIGMLAPAENAKSGGTQRAQYDDPLPNPCLSIGSYTHNMEDSQHAGFLNVAATAAHAPVCDEFKHSQKAI